MTTIHPTIARCVRAAADSIYTDDNNISWAEDPALGFIPDSFAVDGDIDLNRLVIAVLRALREPDEGMREALSDRLPYALYDDVGDENAITIFQAMIGSLLPEEVQP